MAASAETRLWHELKSLSTEVPEGITVAPVNDNIMTWHAVIIGSDNTPFCGGVFKLSIHFPMEYPYKAPAVRFLSKMFHPNVFGDGTVCVDILQNRWSPAYNVFTILSSIQALLYNPDTRSTANAEAARLCKEQRREYDKRVRKTAQQSLWVDSSHEP